MELKNFLLLSVTDGRELFVRAKSSKQARKITRKLFNVYKVRVRFTDAFTDTITDYLTSATPGYINTAAAGFRASLLANKVVTFPFVEYSKHRVLFA